MGGSWGHYAKRNKLDKGRQILYDIFYMWNLKPPKKQKPTVTDTEKRSAVARGRASGWGLEKWLNSCFVSF